MKQEEATDEPRDEILMARYADGDPDAFDALFRRYEHRAYAFFFKRTRSRERAQDLYQDLFLRVHRARAAYDVSRPFAPWFFSIARHLWIDDQCRAHRSHELPIGDRELRIAAPERATPAVDRDELVRVLGALTPEERFVLVSSKLEGVQYGELALELGKSIDAVKKMASRALQRLRGGAPRSVHAS